MCCGVHSAVFGQTWLVFNGAIHTWNLYKNLLSHTQTRTAELYRLVPLLKELFQRLLDQPSNTYGAILQAFTEFCSRVALVRHRSDSRRYKLLAAVEGKYS